MAKRLNTTVHLLNDDGETTVLGPQSKLSRADLKNLNDLWGKKSAEFLEDDGDPAPEELDQVEDVAGERPNADQMPADSTPQVKAAQGVREKVRTDANPEGKASSK